MIAKRHEGCRVGRRRHWWLGMPDWSEMLDAANRARWGIEQPRSHIR